MRHTLTDKLAALTIEQQKEYVKQRQAGLGVAESIRIAATSGIRLGMALFDNRTMPNGLGDYHGSAYDRGGADSYYGRPKKPHYYPKGTYNGDAVTVLTAAELHAYNLGYDSNSARK